METQSLKIEIGSYADFKACYDDLLKPHWEESAKNKHLMVLNPDWNRYKFLEDTGGLLTLCAYVEDKMVGYSCNIITNHLHYSDLKTGYNDLIFIHKDYRNTPLGLRLIRRTEEELKKLDVKIMIWHAKEGTSLDKILPRMKCKVQEIMYSKEL